MKITTILTLLTILVSFAMGCHASHEVMDFWGNYDARKAPLNVEVVKEWETTTGKYQLVRYDLGKLTGTNKSASPVIAAYYGYPKGMGKVPGIVQIHGGGQIASKGRVETWVELGYACISINWGAKVLEEPDTPNTDWDGLAAGFIRPGITKEDELDHHNLVRPDENTLFNDPHILNSSWSLIAMSARRALTFLEQRPEVDGDRLGVEGHSMGGRATVYTAIDSRVKAASPSVGGSGYLYQDLWGLSGSKRHMNPEDGLELYRQVVSAQSYWPHITAPILFLGASNDFNSPTEWVVKGMAGLPEKTERMLALAPHLNHRFTTETDAARFMWMEAHLKGNFEFPRQSPSQLDLDTPNGVPVLSVKVDQSANLPIENVEVYYGYARDPRIRFWRSAEVTQKGEIYTAACPIFDVDEPLFAFANITYQMDRTLPARPGKAATDLLTVTSEYQSAYPDALTSAGVKATGKPQRVIDDFSRGWQDWYRLNVGNHAHWFYATRKVLDPSWMGPKDGKLAFDIVTTGDTNTLAVGIEVNTWQGYTGRKRDKYFAFVDLSVSGSHSILLRASDFNNENGEALEDWETITEIYFTPSNRIKSTLKTSIDWRGESPELKNLRWKGGTYIKRPHPHEARDKYHGVKTLEFESEFQEAIHDPISSENFEEEDLKPNVLIIYADDIGRGDLSCWGQEAFTTPNIDRLAEQGMRFDHFYGCTVCAPARAGLLTGNTNAHSPIPNAGGLECQLAAGLISQRAFDVSVLERRSNRPGRYFLGHMAKSAGYATAYFGKLGVGYTETAAFLDSYGFDYHVGLYDSVICWSYFPEYYWEDGEKVFLHTNPEFDRATPHCPMIGEEEMIYSEDVWLNKCLDYIRERAGKNEPFLAIYASQLPHGPVSIAPKDYVFTNRTDWSEKERVYASMMVKLDQSVGKLLDGIEQQGLTDNTLVIFMGDNGHEPKSYTSPDPSGILNGFWDGHHRGEDRFYGTLGQRGIKRHNFEGGLNVPFIIRWPEKIEAGLRSARRTAVYDIFPTLSDILEVEIPVTIDGLSFLPTLTGKGVQSEPEYLFWMNTSGGTKEAIIANDWKLIKEIDREKSDAAEKRRIYRPALYYLTEDPYEKTDLSSRYPEKVEALEKLIVEAMKPLN